MRRETSRVSLLMCPFRLRELVPGATTALERWWGSALTLACGFGLRAFISARRVTVSLNVGGDRGVRVQRERAGLRLVSAARACAGPDDVAAVRGAERDRRCDGERCGSGAADCDVDAGRVGGDALAAPAGRGDG